jgi:hypothetical protein
MSDEEDRYKVCFFVHTPPESQINFSLKARPAAQQQRYFEKDIFGSDSELSDAPDAEGV